MILPDQIIKSNRNTLSLSVQKDGTVVVRAPSKMKDEHIKDFVSQKQDWLTSKLLFIKNNQDKFNDVLCYKKFLMYGIKYSLIVADVKKIEVDKDTILFPKKVAPEKTMQSLISYYKKQAKEILLQRLMYLKGLMKIEPSSIKISNSKGRWGSCSSNGTITLNWRIIMLPPADIDYVIIHELCHLVELNHSKRFWSLVSMFLPNFNELRNGIKEYGFLLDLYR